MRGANERGLLSRWRKPQDKPVSAADLERERRDREKELGERVGQLILSELHEDAVVEFQIDGYLYRLHGEESADERRLDLEMELPGHMASHEDPVYKTVPRRPLLEVSFEPVDDDDEHDDEDWDAEQYGAWYYGYSDQPRLDDSVQDLLLEHGTTIVQAIRDWNQSPAWQGAEKRRLEREERDARLARVDEENRDAEAELRAQRIRETERMLANEG